MIGSDCYFSSFAVWKHTKQLAFSLLFRGTFIKAVMAFQSMPRANIYAEYGSNTYCPTLPAVKQLTCAASNWNVYLQIYRHSRAFFEAIVLHLDSVLRPGQVDTYICMYVMLRASQVQQHTLRVRFYQDAGQGQVSVVASRAFQSLLSQALIFCSHGGCRSDSSVLQGQVERLKYAH